MDSPRIGVTGATGSVGGRIASRLAERGVAQRLIVRDPSRAPNLPYAEVETAGYLDKQSMVSALSGIGTVFFVSAHGTEDRMRHHKAAVEAFAEAGVRRVVYTSFVGAAPDATFTFARHHYHTEEHLKEAGLQVVALRDSFYMEILPQWVTEGVIRGPAGDGKFAPVARDDVADVAVSLLLDGDHPAGAYDVTGPSLVTMSDVARLISEARGEQVEFVNETEEEAYASRTDIEASEFEVEAWVTSYLAIARGEVEVVSDTVERIAGHPPISLREFLAAGSHDRFRRGSE